LLANTYRQMGYGSENHRWRNFFLSETTKHHSGNFGTPTRTASIDVISQLTPEILLDGFAVQINGPDVWKETVTIDVAVTHLEVQYRLWLSNGALHSLYHGGVEDEC
jgi:alkyl sulfatase BDS1-like metallo-beta-lactamase superfamily hydrolase